MKLFKYYQEGKSKCGVEIGTLRYDTSTHFNDYDEMFFETRGIDKINDLYEKNLLSPMAPTDIKFTAPIAKPSKIVCIGLNYAKHAAEAGATVPPEPVIFFKATTAICGPFDDVIIPRNSVKTDWEVELAVVIGKKASYIEESEAMNYVAGYTIHNDYSERAFQLERSGQWVKGKSNDTFAPLGPYLVTPDEIKDPHNLRLWLSVNGEMLQDSNTDDMVYKIPFVIAYLSQFMTLLPGDVISTGTPFGVGLGLNPPRYLKAGDKVRLGIDGLGEQRQVAKDWLRL
jgi:2,4-diketo-3-deoxy-L-fuconate hydrolase